MTRGSFYSNHGECRESKNVPLQLSDIASMREEPYLKANLEIVEAKSLVGKGRTEGNSLIFTLCREYSNLSENFSIQMFLILLILHRVDYASIIKRFLIYTC